MPSGCKLECLFANNFKAKNAAYRKSKSIIILDRNANNSNNKPF